MIILLQAIVHFLLASSLLQKRSKFDLENCRVLTKYIAQNLRQKFAEPKHNLMVVVHVLALKKDGLTK